MNLTPSTKGSFLAGIGLWALIWAALFKADDIAEAVHLEQWVRSEHCLGWINRHKSTSLLTTELVNFSHATTDPLGVTFALGGTLVNLLVIFILLPCRNRLFHRTARVTESHRL